MTKYSPEFKQNALKQLFPPHNLSMQELSDKEAIPISTLYTWRQQKIREGAAMPSSKRSTYDAWTAEQKLAVVVETYVMNSEEMNTYCREKGFYSDLIKTWKSEFLSAHSSNQKMKPAETSQQKESNKKIKSLEKELYRKEKALAETAALLTLGKKFEALWVEKEGN